MDEDRRRDGYDDLISRRNFLIKAGRIGLATGLLGVAGSSKWFAGRAWSQLAAPSGPQPSIYYPHTFFPALVRPGEPISAAFTLPGGASIKSLALKSYTGPGGRVYNRNILFETGSDGSDFLGQSPSHAYAKDGNYTVTLTVKEINGFTYVTLLRYMPLTTALLPQNGGYQQMR